MLQIHSCWVRPRYKPKLTRYKHDGGDRHAKHSQHQIIEVVVHCNEGYVGSARRRDPKDDHCPRPGRLVRSSIQWLGPSNVVPKFSFLTPARLAT